VLVLESVFSPDQSYNKRARRNKSIYSR